MERGLRFLVKLIEKYSWLIYIPLEYILKNSVCPVERKRSRSREKDVDRYKDPPRDKDRRRDEFGKHTLALKVCGPISWLHDTNFRYPYKHWRNAALWGPGKNMKRPPFHSHIKRFFKDKIFSLVYSIKLL